MLKALPSSRLTVTETKTIALREHKTLNANRRSLDPSKILLELCLEKCVVSCHERDHEHNQNGGTPVTLETKRRNFSNGDGHATATRTYNSAYLMSKRNDCCTFYTPNTCVLVHFFVFLREEKNFFSCPFVSVKFWTVHVQFRFGTSQDNYATNNSNLYLPPQSLLRKLPVTRTEAATDEHSKTYFY